MYDVIIVGAGPAGLSAALNFGRARKSVLLCDAGVPRNARASEIHGFVTRDGTPPGEFRRIANEQLTPYATVTRSDQLVTRIDGERDRFVARLGAATGHTVQARRVLLCVGMVDELPDLAGYRELWGHAIFQCPYCHGYELRDRPFGYLLPAPEWLDFALFLQGWSSDLVVFTDGKYELPSPARDRLAAAAIALEERPIRRLKLAPGAAAQPRLSAVELVDGTLITREVLFARPPQRQVALVQQLGLALDEAGCVRVDPLSYESSRPGIYAAGDLTTMMQGAIGAANAGMMATARLNHELSLAARHGTPPA